MGFVLVAVEFSAKTGDASAGLKVERVPTSAADASATSAELASTARGGDVNASGEQLEPAGATVEKSVVEADAEVASEVGTEPEAVTEEATPTETLADASGDSAVERRESDNDVVA